MADAFEFYLDADDAYKPKELPTGLVKMGGKEYTVRCPKDSLPMLLGRINRRVGEDADPAEQESIIRQIVGACFAEEDTDEIMDRVVDPFDLKLSVGFLVDTVQKVYQAYLPMLDADYEELGIENPIKKPQDRQTSRKPGARKAAAAAAPVKRAAAKRAPAKPRRATA